MEYKYPNESFFGKELYSEIVHTSSKYEKEIGAMIINKVEKIASYQGLEEDVKNMEDVGSLKEFYYFSIKGAKTQTVDLKLITCIINKNEGHVWIDYTRRCYDDNNKLFNGSGDVLMLCYIERQEEEWKVVKIMEAP